MRIALLCNLIGLPALQALAGQGSLVGIGISQTQPEAVAILHQLAQAHGLPFVAVSRQNLRSSLSEWLQVTQAEVVFVMGFSYKIPPDILRRPRFGFFNFHAGRLPHYRGPDPMFWQIKNQETFGELTVHQMDEQFDSGPIVHTEKIPILPDDTYGLHFTEVARAGHPAALAVAAKLPHGLTLQPQDPAQAAYQPKPSFQDLLIDWSTQPAAAIQALIRACNPNYGGALTFLRGQPLRLLQASLQEIQPPPAVQPGTIIAASLVGGLQVCCCDQKLLNLEVGATQQGYFSGASLATIARLQAGETFTPPPATGPV